MTDEKHSDPFRPDTSESGTTTQGSSSTKGGHAESGKIGGQDVQKDQGSKTGEIGNTGVGPDWMVGRPGADPEHDREASDKPVDA